MNKLDNINNYKTIIFDCDGVVLNSNKVKTQAFYNTALAFGQAAAERLVKYHVERGGISRYKKFQWFIDNLNEEDLAQSKDQPNLDNLLSGYAAEVHKGLRSCQIADGLDELREKTKDSIWLIVSGGDQAELRELFAERDIAQLFDGGIFGSPDSKEVIMNRKREQVTLSHLLSLLETVSMTIQLSKALEILTLSLLLIGVNSMNMSSSSKRKKTC